MNTIATMLDALPTDPASLFILALLGGICILVVVYGMRSGGNDEQEKKKTEERDPS